MAAAGGTADADAAAAPPPPWDALPEEAALAVLHFLDLGHAKVARAVCRAWRDTLDSQATHATLGTWPAGGRGSGGASCSGGGGPGPRRPLHAIAPRVSVVDLTLLPPDEEGGRLEALLDDLAGLTGCGGRGQAE
jgi:hypothetical protein